MIADEVRSQRQLPLSSLSDDDNEISPSKGIISLMGSGYNGPCLDLAFYALQEFGHFHKAIQ